MTIIELPGSSAPAAGPTVLGYFTPGSEEWHAARANGIGGSEIAAVVGLSPHESRFSLWHRKQGLLAPVEESPQMYWGKVHEPNILREFAKRHPEFSVRKAPTYAAVDRPEQIANPDGLLIPACDCGPFSTRHAGPRPACLTWPTGGAPAAELVEAKTAIDDAEWGVEGTDEIPVHYRCQCLWYLDVLGLTRCHVAVLIGGWDYREYVVEYDADEARILREAGAEFMESVRGGQRPSIDGHTATYRAIRVLPEGLDDVNVEVPADLRDRFHAAQDRAWAAEDELTECKGRLLDAIGTGRRAVVGPDRVATRTVRNGRTYQLLPARNRRTAR